MKQQLRPYLLYIIPTVLIAVWWFGAFYSTSTQTPRAPEHSLSSFPRRTVDGQKLSALDRENLRLALGGDLAIIERLLSDWELDAKILKDAGIQGVKTLDKDNLLEARKLIRSLSLSSEKELAQLRETYRLKEVMDETGHVLDLNSAPERFLPQTYVSTNLLLALVDPEQIVAIPPGIRKELDLYAPGISDQIPLDADRYESERIYQEQPDVSFIANYSKPSTVQMLRNQGISLFSFSQTNTLEEVLDGLERMGHVVNRPLKARLMSLFIQAALSSLDNRVAHAKQEGAKWPERVLYLNAFSRYSVPTTKTLTAEMLQRLGLDQLIREFSNQHSTRDWSVPISLEQIVHLNPDCIVISSPAEQKTEMVRRLASERALLQVEAVRKQRVIAIDEEIQSSPSQYVVLAYFDLVEAVEGLADKN